MDVMTTPLGVTMLTARSIVLLIEDTLLDLLGAVVRRWSGPHGQMLERLKRWRMAWQNRELEVERALDRSIWRCRHRLDQLR
jgi:hypothetical protein